VRAQCGLCGGCGGAGAGAGLGGVAAGVGGGAWDAAAAVERLAVEAGGSLL
jgi:hypothetical protein